MWPKAWIARLHTTEYPMWGVRETICSASASRPTRGTKKPAWTFWMDETTPARTSYRSQPLEKPDLARSSRCSGGSMAAENFLRPQTVMVFALGVVAFATATAFGVLIAKLMNKVSREPINPMIGAAGVSAVPMAARVVQTMGQKANPRNFLLMHAMGPNIAGVIGTVVAAGVFLGIIS